MYSLSIRDNAQPSRSLSHNLTPFLRPLSPAGVAMRRNLSADGIDECFGTNFIGHFVLTIELMPLIQATPAARYDGSVYFRWGVVLNRSRPTSNGLEDSRHLLAFEISTHL